MMSQGKSMDDYSALNPLGRVPFHMQLTTMLKDDIARSYSGGAEEAGMKGLRGHATEVVASINPLVLRHRIIV